MSAGLKAAPVPTLRPVPWRRLGWVAWRRYRATLVATGLVLGVVATYLLVRGDQMRNAFAAARSCTPQDSAACHFAWDTFQTGYGSVGFVGGVIVFVPGVLGAFAGAPLLARELETGTFRFVWTQGAGRLRWLWAMLVPGVVGAVVVGVVYGTLVTWYDQPLVDYGDLQRLHPTVFMVTGTAVVGWVLLAYTGGVLAGVLARRVVHALAATMAGWTGLAFLTADLRKYHYAAPLTTSNPLPALGDQPVGEWWTYAGVRVSNAQVNHVLQAIGVQTGSASGGGIAARNLGRGVREGEHCTG